MIIVKNKKLLLSLGLFFVAFLFTGCSLFNNVTTVGETILTSIVVDPAIMTIAKGGSKTITSVTAYYDNGTSANIALSSCTYASNRTNVTVANGKISVSANCAATTATITVSYTEDNIPTTDTVNVTITGG